MKKSRVAVLLLMSLLILSCVACQGNVNQSPETTPTPTSTLTATLGNLSTSGWIGPDGETEYEYVPKQGFLRGGDGHLLILVNNPQAHDPSWEELKEFLHQDKTDKHLFTDSFVCADFAEMLHNNAEEAGIMSAYVTIEFNNTYIDHALNAFNTSDMGMIYIDDTGSRYYYPCSLDHIVEVELNKEYLPSLIFPCAGYELESIGNVFEIYIQW
jgi:hypothetical protein